ncbi:MAG: hypothetical protein M3022_02430 [Actinomycetota bacterium]|nr:hypothetical protein [Actinomycetota bacterium]
MATLADAGSSGLEAMLATASDVHSRGTRRRRLLPSRRLTAMVPVLTAVGRAAGRDRPGSGRLVGCHRVPPWLIPPGPTPNTGLDGYRTLPSALWVRRPGCYEVQVDGLNFTDDDVISAIAARPFPGETARTRPQFRSLRRGG